MMNEVIERKTYAIFIKNDTYGGVSMPTINEEKVKEIADLAKLSLTEEEVEQMTKHLRSFMDFAEKLKELNTDDVERTTHVFPEQTIALRKDEAKRSLTQEEALLNAPDKQDGQFKVPSILE